MPTNLPPEYFDAERRFREASSDLERISCLEELLSCIPKHKGTDKLRADYRRKYSQLKLALQTARKTGRRESPYHVEKEGSARVVIVGAPNAGKSAMLAAVTHAAPKVSEYEFTTWTPQPGMMPVLDIQVQLVDTPALCQAHVEPELFGLIRTADLVLLVVDLQSRALEQFDETLRLLEEHRIAPAAPRSPRPDDDDRIYAVPCLVLANKADDAQWDGESEALRELLEDRFPLLAVSAKTGRNLEQMKRVIYEMLGIMRIYSKPPGKEVDRHAPFVLKQGATVGELAARVHKDLARNLKTARIWGTDVYDGQMVGRDHVLHDGDVVELHA